MYIVLFTLVVLDLALMALTATLGMTLETGLDFNRHYLAGLLVSTFTCFIHCLVLFYLIGTGKDVRDAVEDVPALAKKYFSWTRRQKVRAFPPACFALVLMILAALMGGEVHSRLLAEHEDGVLPVRGVAFWWVHLVTVVLAVGASVYAFWVELAVVRENRQTIDVLNAELEQAEVSQSGAEDAPEGAAGTD